MRIGLALSLLFWLLLFLTIKQCSANEGFYLELGVGKNGVYQEDWLGRGDVGCYAGTGYLKDFGQWSVDLAYRHSSQCNRGNGYDDRLETINDSVGLYGRYYFGG